MRTLNELYTILYDNIKDEEGIQGLCAWVAQIYREGFITRDEYYILVGHFLYQKPTPDLHPEFYSHKSYTSFVWWWDNYNIKEATQQRKLFIQKMIQITKE